MFVAGVGYVSWIVGVGLGTFVSPDCESGSLTSEPRPNGRGSETSKLAVPQRSALCVDGHYASSSQLGLS